MLFYVKHSPVEKYTFKELCLIVKFVELCKKCRKFLLQSLPLYILHIIDQYTFLYMLWSMRINSKTRKNLSTCCKFSLLKDIRCETSQGYSYVYISHPLWLLIYILCTFSNRHNASLFSCSNTAKLRRALLAICNWVYL